MDKRPSLWLLVLAGCLAFIAVIVAFDIPERIARGENGQAAIQALDAMRLPLLAIKQVRTHLIETRDVAATADDFAAAREKADALLDRYRRIAQYNPQLARRVVAFSSTYADWLAVERHLFEHFPKSARGDNIADGYSHLLTDLDRASTGFLSTLIRLGDGEDPIHRDINGGRRATHIFLATSGMLFFYLLGLIARQQRTKTRAIKSTRDELESQIRLRTRDLAEANERLQQEITERKRTGKVLRESEEKYSALVENGNDGIIIIQDGFLKFANPMMLEILGYTREEMIDKPFIDFISPEHKEFVLDRYKKRMAGDDVPSKYDIEIITKNGRKITLEIHASLIEYKGRLANMAIVSDITERKQMEDALRKLAEGVSAAVDETFFQSLAQHIVQTLDVDYALVAELSETDAGRASTVAVCFRGEIVENFEYTLAGTPCEHVVKRGLCCYPHDVQKQFPEDKMLVKMDVNGYMGMPLRDATGSAMGLLTVWDSKPLANIESAKSIFQVFAVRAAAELEHNQMREQARQRRIELTRISRLNTMGEMASTMAHEINQPLCAIATYVQACLRMLKSRKVDAKETIAAMEAAKAEVSRAGEIVHSIKRFVQKDEPRQNELNINDRIREAVGIVKSEALQGNIKIHLRLEDGLPPVMADDIQIEQVLLNLLRNGVEAVEVGRRELTVDTSRAAGNNIEVKIIDNGSGVDASVADNMFDPLVTTKPDGMGMGLSISRSIIEAHGGKLWWRANDGGGTIFGFSLPVYRGANDSLGLAEGARLSR